MIAIDGLWWSGGNRFRGVGRYLDAWFRTWWKVAPDNRLWLVMDQSAGEELTAVYGGQWELFPFAAEESAQVLAWKKILERQAISQVFLPSPFERPWSLLDLGQSLFTIPVEAIVFDLLPWQHPVEILQTWSEADQSLYLRRLDQLHHAQKLWVISPAVAQAVQDRFGEKAPATTVITAGLSPDWVGFPVALPRWTTAPRPVAVTIAGGEWRKNLTGTLQWFSKALPSYDLVVIGKLGRRERYLWRWRALRLGIAGRVHWVGQISDQAKWQYLCQAEALIFLSKAEGLGIPLLEAKAAGVPRVVVSPELEHCQLAHIGSNWYEVALPLD